MGGKADDATPLPAPPELVLADEESRTSLLRRITEEGGFAFVSSAEKAAAGDLRAADAAREMAWEQLHSGPWNEVVPAWRDAYAMACLHVAALRDGAGDRSEAIRALDMGIIMGGPLLRPDLDAALQRIMAQPLPEVSERQDSPERLVCEEDSKGLDLTEVLRILPKKSLSCKIVEKRSSLSLERFVSDYFLKGCPIIISGYIDGWPARTKWKDIEYLKRIAGDRTVPVEVGQNYLCSEWKQELITFSQFLERIVSADCPSKLTYLAQHPLFDQIKELRNDIMIPDYCFAGGGELQSLNAWFGPPGTVTPLHHDPHHNLFAQVVGRKYIRLYPSSVSEELHPYVESMLSNSSQVSSVFHFYSDNKIF
ncbi:[histone H3]-lysine-36 demethylase protein [Dioscorea alata]|uniref:[histone H3]-lysine-36 demethylase protein n=2 Tax=Dioscorea alata TaxID=55571 RepID=A0ACB7VJ33_DIOAL|nr:[histone H3]-lysine-36 demethylase protein [Dioscorea alata]KAH7674096.1 [histone H3]-lysine-36 demethylase protein [Dioscorea alata]